MNKNKNNPRRLPNYLGKHSVEICKQIDAYISGIVDADVVHQVMIQHLRTIRQGVVATNIEICSDVLDEIVKMQKMLSTIQ